MNRRVVETATCGTSIATTRRSGDIWLAPPVVSSTISPAGCSSPPASPPLPSTRSTAIRWMTRPRPSAAPLRSSRDAACRGASCASVPAGRPRRSAGPAAGHPSRCIPFSPGQSGLRRLREGHPLTSLPPAASPTWPRSWPAPQPATSTIRRSSAHSSPLPPSPTNGSSSTSDGSRAGAWPSASVSMTTPRSVCTSSACGRSSAAAHSASTSPSVRSGTVPTAVPAPRSSRPHPRGTPCTSGWASGESRRLPPVGLPGDGRGRPGQPLTAPRTMPFTK